MVQQEEICVMSLLDNKMTFYKSCKRKPHNECIAEITTIILIDYFIKNIF